MYTRHSQKNNKSILTAYNSKLTRKFSKASVLVNRKDRRPNPWTNHLNLAEIVSGNVGDSCNFKFSLAEQPQARSIHQPRQSKIGAQHLQQGRPKLEAKVDALGYICNERGESKLPQEGSLQFQIEKQNRERGPLRGRALRHQIQANCTRVLCSQSNSP
jgi:hypothetical protein